MSKTIIAFEKGYAEDGHVKLKNTTNGFKLHSILLGPVRQFKFHDEEAPREFRAPYYAIKTEWDEDGLFLVETQNHIYRRYDWLDMDTGEWGINPKVCPV